MTQFTTILDQESGIQFDGVRDSGEENNQPIHGLIVGKFRRGRFDRSMTITEKNIRGVLGHDSKNPYYRMVQDVLNSGVDSIQVLRVPGDYFDIKPAPIFGSWILNPGVSILNGVATYTGYKTNTIDTYDSHANLDLTAAIVRSLHDSDMQQWQAVKDAANELTGVTNWVLDPANNQIRYKDPNSSNSSSQYLYYYVQYPLETFSNPVDACMQVHKIGGGWAEYVFVSYSSLTCKWTYGGEPRTTQISSIVNPAYDPNAEDEYKTIPLSTVAQKVISNASSSNQAISLLAEAYLEAVANSISNADESKQFVKLADIDPLFEANKVLRVL